VYAPYVEHVPPDVTAQIFWLKNRDPAHWRDAWHLEHVTGKYRDLRHWLATRPAGRFDFTFTPKHGSWLNLVEGFFSKFARSVLRHIRVTSKHELKERIMAGIADVNRHPVIHTWSYKLAEACLI
jgi:DDE superfamily endonuclease